jgi:predicted nucleic acid-binding protein
VTLSDQSPVVVDTGAFGAQFTPRGQPLAFTYRPIVADRAVILSYAAVAELRFGAARAGWGTRRMRRLDAELGKVDTIWPGPELVAAYVSLRVWCVQAGHGLAGKEHEADRWIAATAIWLDIPLVAHDSIFKGVQNLELLTMLDAESPS